MSATGLVIPTNLRDTPLTISNEQLTIPTSSPYKARLTEVPLEVSGVKLRRITTAVKTGGGGSAMVSLGYFVGLVSKSMRVEITLAGGIGVAEYRWSNTGGTTWNGSNLPIGDTNPIPLELGIEIAFSDAGGSFVLGERWDFEAQNWTEVTTVPVATKTFLVNYTNGVVTFYSGDSTVVVYATYEGRGSVVKAEDVSQLITTLDAGELVFRNQDTSAFTIRRFVHVNSSGTLEEADAVTSKPAWGCVKVVDSDEGEIVVFGVVGGFSSLTPGAVYYLVADGQISTIPSTVFRQVVGRAISTTQILVSLYLEQVLPLDLMGYGEMYGDNIDQEITILAINTYYQVGGGLSGGLNGGFTFQNLKELKCTIAGVYRIVWFMSLEAAVSPTEIEGAVMLNGTAQTKGTAHAEASVGGVSRPETMGGTLNLVLAVDDLISLAVSNHTDAANVVLQHASLTIGRVGF